MFARATATTSPDKPALVMVPSGRTITFADYEARADRAAQFFRSVGLRRGDHVAFLMENNPEMVMCEAGAERAGLYYTCVNHFLARDEAAYVVNDCQAKVVVTSAAKADLAAQLPALCPGVEHWVMADSDRPPAPFSSLDLVLAEQPSGPIADEQLGAAMLYSSGTTGRPKGIMRSLPEAHPADEVPAVTFMTGIWQMTGESVYLSPAPLYHAAPQGSVSMALRLGATAVVLEKFDPRLFLDAVERFRVTHSQVVPTMFTRLLKLPDGVRASADVSSLVTIIHSAAPCPPEVKRRMIEWFGPIIIEFYAASEGIGFTYCDSHEWLAHPGTVGREKSGTVLILDEGGAPCPTGTPGIIWFSGNTDFEYFNEPDKTAATKSADGSATSVGDIGYLDDERYLYLTDRASFMIISGGTNIYPQETENLLVMHPQVLDVAVIGVPDDDLGEVVKAVVELVDGVEPSPELAQELIDHCRDNMAHYKCPRSVDFVEHLPRLDTGKLYKKALREQYWAGRATRIA
jgi:long-chain acyl-CoA synthetase